MGNMNKVVEQALADLPEETTAEEKNAIDEDTVRDELFSHPTVVVPEAKAVRRQLQIVETARYVLAMDDVFSITRRRITAQRLVAKRTEPEHGDSDSMSPQAVQDTVRQLFDGRYGSEQSAQDLFDDVLADVEESYQVRVETR